MCWSKYMYGKSNGSFRLVFKFHWTPCWSLTTHSKVNSHLIRKLFYKLCTDSGGYRNLWRGLTTYSKVNSHLIRKLFYKSCTDSGGYRNLWRGLTTYSKVNSHLIRKLFYKSCTDSGGSRNLWRGLQWLCICKCRAMMHHSWGLHSCRVYSWLIVIILPT